MYRFTDTGTFEASFSFTNISDDVDATGVDFDDSIWVAYYDGDSFLKYDQYMSFISSFATPSNAPTGVAFDQNGCIWSDDYNAERIYKLDDQVSAISCFSAPSGYPQGTGVEYTFAGAGGSEYTQLLDEAVMGRKN